MDTSKDKYWVVGGLYTDTDFKTLVEGTELEEYGPFDTHEEAEDVWRAKSWLRVDECSCRYRVLVDMEFECSKQQEIEIKQAAKIKGISVSAYICYALEQYFEDHPFTRQDFLEISE